VKRMGFFNHSRRWDFEIILDTFAVSSLNLVRDFQIVLGWHLSSITCLAIRRTQKPTNSKRALPSTPQKFRADLPRPHAPPPAAGGSSSSPHAKDPTSSSASALSFHAIFGLASVTDVCVGVSPARAGQQHAGDKSCLVPQDLRF